MTNPNALIFDFDGLLCDTESCLVAAGRKVFNRYGVEFPLDRWVEVIGTSTPPNFWVPWLTEHAAEKLDEVELLREFDSYNHAAVGALLPNEGVVELLDLAHAEAIPVGVASSSSIGWVGGLLEQFDLRHRFSHVLTRGDVQNAKPAPDLYLLAAQRFSSDPSECVAFEDSRNGSLAAHTAGMPCVVVPNELTSRQDLSHATHRVTSLRHITLDTLKRVRSRTVAIGPGSVL